MTKLSMEEVSSGHESTGTTQATSSDVQQSSATSLLIDKLFSDTSGDSDAQPKDVDCTEGWEYRRTAKVGGV